MKRFSGSMRSYSAWGTDELHEARRPNANENVDDQAVFVATQIKDHPIISDEIDSPAELPFLFRPDWSTRGLGRNRDPGPRIGPSGMRG